MILDVLVQNFKVSIIFITSMSAYISNVCRIHKNHFPFQPLNLWNIHCFRSMILVFSTNFLWISNQFNGTKVLQYLSFKVWNNGVRTITPEENCPQLGLGFGSRLGKVLGMGSNQTIAPEENYPPVRVRGWVRVSF